MRSSPAAHLVLACLLLTIGGCENASEDPATVDPQDAEPTTFTDDLGRQIDLAVPPTRVLTLAPNLTELVFMAGGGPLVPAVSTADTYPPRVESLPRYGLLPLDTEAIVALEPDLLLATTQVNTVESVASLGALGVPTFFFSFEQLANIPLALRTLDALLGTDGGERAAQAFERRVAAFRALTDTLNARPSVLLLVGDEILYAFGGASYTQRFIDLAGGRSVTADLDGQQAVLSDEFVLQADPDVIVVLAGEDYDTSSLVDAHPTFATLDAVRGDRVFGLDPDHISRPGPRVVLGIEALLRRLHPTLGESLPPPPSSYSTPGGGSTS